MESDAAEDIKETNNSEWWIPSSRIGCIAPRTALTVHQLRQAYDLCQPGRIILNPSPLQENNMTKTHFTEIAKRLNFFHFNPDFDILIDNFCEYFNSINPRFDEKRFRHAVYKER